MLTNRNYLIISTLKAFTTGRSINSNIRKVILYKRNLSSFNIQPVNTANMIVNRFYSQKLSQEKNLIVDFNYVRKATENSDIVMIDVREPSEIQELGQIPNSINIPLGNVTSVLSMSEKNFEKDYGRKKPEKNTEIIFYCRVGGRSEKAQKEAINLGYQNVKNYLGSYTDWIENVNK